MHTNTHVHTYTHTPFSMLSQRQALGTYFHRDTSLLFLSSYAKSTIREVKVIFRFSSRYNIVSGLQSKCTLDLQLIYIYIFIFFEITTCDFTAKEIAQMLETHAVLVIQNSMTVTLKEA